MAILEGDGARAKTSSGTNLIRTAKEHDGEMPGPTFEDGERYNFRASLSNSAGISW